MATLPVLSGKKLLKVLKKHGYQMIRHKGSHIFVENSDGSHGTAVPVHGNEDLGKGMIKRILNDLELSVDDLSKMLK